MPRATEVGSNMKSLQEKETEFGFFLVTPVKNIIPQEEARSEPREANSDEGIFPALAVEDIGAIHDVALAINLHNYKNSQVSIRRPSR